MGTNLKPSDYDQYVETYNTKGREAAYAYATLDCNMDFAAFKRKMRNETKYVYIRSEKRYEKHNEESQFMSLEDLCSKKNPKVKLSTSPISVERKTSFDEIVIDLMRDRLTEISKYIKFDQSTKQCIIYSKGLNENGYELTIL